LIRHPDVEGVVIIHEMIMKRMGSSSLGLLYPGGLPYCVDTAQDIRHSSELRRTLSEMAAYYIWCLITNHPFVDGNKRTAFQTAEVFLRANGFSLSQLEPDEVVSTLLRVATGEIPVVELTDWVEKHLSPGVTPGQ
jgi:death on curing protein